MLAAGDALVKDALLLGAILLLAGGVRLAALEAARPIAPVGDEVYYAQLADHIARGRGHLYVDHLGYPWRAWRPPAHPWLLSLGVDTSAPATGDPTQSAPLLLRYARLQVALGTLWVGVCALLGRALFGARTGLLAGLVAALNPALITHSHLLWSETLFGLLVTTGLLGGVWLARRPSWALAGASGVVFGLAALTREVALVTAGVCVAWRAWLAPGDRRRALAQGGLLLLVAVAVVAPWTLRNWKLFDRFVPVSTVGWFALAEGNSLERPQWLARSGSVLAAFHRDYFSRRDEMSRMDLARRHAFARIAAEQPGWLPKKLVRNLALLLNPDSVLRMKIRRGSYGDLPRALPRALFAASIPFYLALVTLATLGLAASPTGPARLGSLLFASVVLLHVLANATPRFRVPWLPLLAVYASHALWNLPRLPRRLGSRPGLAALVFLLFFFAVCVPYFVAFGGRP
jgi:4-amino-4-deoxy-L-arabinose transferase-like glycosyltransferase